MNTLNRALLTWFRPLLAALEECRRHPEQVQENTFRQLAAGGTGTAFGREHGFSRNMDYAAFRRLVPVREYDNLRPYIDRARSGEDSVLWNEPVRWFAKSSGTSSDKSKFIPVTPDNLKRCHYRGFRLMLASYLQNNPDSRIMLGKALTLGGSVAPDALGREHIFSGDLSAILLKNSPFAAELLRVPARKTALIADFSEKVERICRECSRADVTNFSGVPSWNLILMNRILEYNQVRTLPEIWPNLELFMHGGISFEPYREQFRKIIPSDRMHYLENYNASEGYFAFQDEPGDRGMLLTLDNGVFYEFIPLDELDRALGGDSSAAVPLEGVRTGIPYALVITTNSGLWRYLIGDCIEFTSIRPYKIVITGRTKLFINAFGEELMIGNAERALADACRQCGATVADYTVAPVFMEGSGKGAHEWAVEFSHTPEGFDPEHFADLLDAALCRQNSDYEAKRTANATMERLRLRQVPAGTFLQWMQLRGKAGGQHKVPRLFRDRRYLEDILRSV